MSEAPSWVPVADGSPWGVQTLAYGVAALPGGPRVVVRIGDFALDAAAVAGAVEPHLVPLAGLGLRLPFEVADYVDFYSSRHHAENLPSSRTATRSCCPASDGDATAWPWASARSGAASCPRADSALIAGYLVQIGRLREE